MNDLKLTSLFTSINGECCLAGQGSFAIFVRFAGCTAGCKYCDTKYSTNPNKGESINYIKLASQIIHMSDVSGIDNVTITGGEPLEQENDHFEYFVRKLVNFKLNVSIETNGLHPFNLPSFSDRQVSIVADYKLPSSGISFDTPRYIPSRSGDFIKFVISDRTDYEIAKSMIMQWVVTKETNSKIYLSPNVAGLNNSGVSLVNLINWMKEDGLTHYDVGFSLQIHKYIFGDNWRMEEE